MALVALAIAVLMTGCHKQGITGYAPTATPTADPSIIFAPTVTPTPSPTASPKPTKVTIPKECRYITVAQIESLFDLSADWSTDGGTCWYEVINTNVDDSGHGVGVRLWPAIFGLPTEGKHVAGVGRGARWLDGPATLYVQTGHGILEIDDTLGLDELPSLSREQIAIEIYKLAAPRLP